MSVCRRVAVGFAGLTLVGALLASCHVPRTLSESQRQKVFDSLAEQVLLEYYHFSPTASTEDGLHTRDEALETFSREAIAARIARLRQEISALGKLDQDYLTLEEQADAAVLDDRLHAQLLALEEIRPWERDPGLYVDLAARSIHGLIERDFAPAEQRLACVIRREELFDRFFAQARANLAHCSKLSVETAVEKARSTAEFLKQEVPAAFTAVSNEKLVESLTRTQAAAIKLLEDYAAWLEKDVLPQADGALSLGEDLYRRGLRYDEGIELTIEQLLERGESERARLRAELAATAEQVAPGRPLADALAEIAKDAPPAERVLEVTRATIEEVRQFCIEKGLVTIPSEVRCQVRALPSYRRPLHVAFLDGPGPLEPRAREAYYQVALPAPSAPAERRGEILALYGKYLLPVRLLGEVYPGRYVQELRLRGCPSKVRRVFGCDAFTEGWAHYCEQMALDAGYGGGDPRFRLAQVLLSLQRVCRYLAEVRIHARGMACAEAAEFLAQEGYFAPGLAELEARRIALEPVALASTWGKLALLDLRSEYQARSGKAYRERRFHDLVLSQGCPPVPILRRFLLGSGVQ